MLISVNVDIFQSIKNPFNFAQKKLDNSSYTPPKPRCYKVSRLPTIYVIVNDS